MIDSQHALWQMLPVLPILFMFGGGLIRLTTGAVRPPKVCWPALALACACLGGCAYAPGLSMGKSAETPVGAAADVPPPGALLRIYP
jgi:hypothetical protein